MKTTTYHLAQSLRGALMNWEDRLWRTSVRQADGHWMTPHEVKTAFLDAIAHGIEVVPFGECDNFDPKKGCRGHPVET